MTRDGMERGLSLTYEVKTMQEARKVKTYCYRGVKYTR